MKGGLEMKAKSIFAASLLVAGAAFADTTEVDTSYVVGVLPVEMSAGQQDIVLNIPWVEPGSSGEGIAVTNLVKTANLQNNDSLVWYDGSGYQAWKISGKTNENAGYWVPAQIISADKVTTAVSATKTDLVRGQALVLHRQGTDAINLYVMGQYTNSTVNTAIAGGTYKTPKYTLIAPPAVTNVNLTAQLASVVPVEGDEVFFMKGGAFVSYSYNGGKWGTTTLDQTKSPPKPVFTEATDEQMTIPKGTGLYYKRKGATTSVTW